MDGACAVAGSAPSPTIRMSYPLEARLPLPISGTSTPRLASRSAVSPRRIEQGDLCFEARGRLLWQHVRRGRILLDLTAGERGTRFQIKHPRPNRHRQFDPERDLLLLARRHRDPLAAGRAGCPLPSSSHESQSLVTVSRELFRMMSCFSIALARLKIVVLARELRLLARNVCEQQAGCCGRGPHRLRSAPSRKARTPDPCDRTVSSIKSSLNPGALEVFPIDLQLAAPPGEAGPRLPEVPIFPGRSRRNAPGAEGMEVIQKIHGDHFMTIVEDPRPHLVWIIHRCHSRPA